MRSTPEAPPTSNTAIAAPVAVVSVGCRLPGGIGDLAGLSRVLQRGEPVLRPVPADRWSSEFFDSTQQRRGTTRSHVGAFLDDIQRFDAEFFGISPREAREMDPQQRILLEVAWEALNATGQPVADWAGSRTGVFTGVLASDYLLLHSKTRGTAAIDPFYATGKEFSFGAGRVAYNFDLHGPVMTITTACSSSLLAVHLACQSLRAGECDAALAGGVNLLVAPELTVFMSQVGAVSPTGRSAPFSATADGVVRGEGCALVLLKRLEDAQRDGDEILAVLNGSAVNHDGHSAGLTVPSAAAQVSLIRQALSSGGIAPDEIGYLEAHATGTPLGDPIELAALSEVFSRETATTAPLLVGSHKAVFGHLDSAAGILGLLKVILVVRDGLIPPQPALDGLTPHFDWAAADLRIATETGRLNTVDSRPRRAGVSAFGLSGTNVHVVVSQPPPATGARNAVRHQPREWSGDSHWLSGVRPGKQGADSVPSTEPVAELGRAETPAAAGPAAALPAAAGPAAALPAAAGPAAEYSEIRNRVNAAVREVLGLENGKPVPAQRPLIEQGLTSITVVELATLLAASFGTPKDPTLVYLCPCVDDLVAHFAEITSQSADGTAAAEPEAAPAVSVQPDDPAQLTSAPAQSNYAMASAPVPAAPAAPKPPAATDSAIQPAIPDPRDSAAALAIIGMACRVPGAATVEEFWQILCAGEAQISDLPEHRRSRDGWSTIPDGVPTRGGYLDNIEGFDAGYFKISPMEAERIDPQQRLFLEVAAEALADAGIVVGTELANRTGVYAGMNTTDYQQRLTRAQSEVDLYFGTGNCFAATPGRLAYALNLGGPCLSVDTACSSSLTAIHLAGQALRSGDCDAAVVGGVNVISGPTVSTSMFRAGALAPDGQCKTFSESADGYGRGEGAGVIVLKRLDRAIADGDQIYATVLGSAINSDGASGGFTVPSAAAQTAVITAALNSAGVSARDIGYVEAHGTGTPLGDPIELQALSKALRPDPDSPVYVGSVKSLIGHLEAAAGVVGLIKAALSVSRDEIAPHQLVGERTSRINWQQLGLRVSTQPAGWPQRPQRLAGVSAFGFTGSNAHIILGQPPAQPVQAGAPSDATTVLALSADSPVALRQHAAQLAEVLASGAAVGDLAYTLARHRGSYRYRAVVLAGSAADAISALTELAADHPHPNLVVGSRPVTEPAGISFHFSDQAYLGADWSYLPDYLRLAGNSAAAEVDRLTPEPLSLLTGSQRQRLATLRSQVGWSAVWQRLGLQRSSATGDGVGSLAAAWACGEISIGTAVERVLQASHDDLQARQPARDEDEDENGSVVIEVVPLCVATAGWFWVQAHSYLAGYDVDWNGTVPETGHRIKLPPYPWQRRDHWFTSTAAEPETPTAGGPARMRPQFEEGHPPAEQAGQAAPEEQLGTIGELLFTHDWQPAVVEPLPEKPDGGRWLIFADTAAVPAADLARQLRDAGQDVDLIAIPESNSADWTSAVAATAAAGSITGVILMAGDRPDAELVTIRFGQAVQRYPGSLGRAHLITCGAYPVNGGVPRPAQAAAWAVGAVLATELSRRWGRLIDLAECGGTDGLAAALINEHADDQLHLDHGQWYARRIHRQPAMPDPEFAAFSPDQQFAVYGPDPASVEPVLRWLAGKNAGGALVCLTGSAPGELGDIALPIRTVTQQGSWLEQLTELATAGKLGGVVYCALSQDEPVTVRDSSDEAGPTDDLLPAVLSRLSDARETGPILLLTDAAGDWGALGAAASGARSARARASVREHAGLSDAARTLALLPRAHPDASTGASALQADSGIGQLTAEQIVEVLDYAVAAPAGTDLSAGVVDVERYVNLCQRLAPRALLNELGSGGSDGGGQSEVLTQLRALSPARRTERLIDLVLTATAALLGLSARELDPDTGFFDLGMDSITAVSLKTRLENETQTELPMTLTFELPTPRKVARHITQLLEPAGSQPITAQSPAADPSEGRQDAVELPEYLDRDAENDAAAGEPTDDELLLMLSQATASAQDLLQEARQW